ncbi:hypothetical protein BJ912DRAFT_856942, partial [Pholiota molesta]
IIALYHNHWNSPADLQAMDREHRIEQAKQVYVSRFTTRAVATPMMLERPGIEKITPRFIFKKGRCSMRRRRRSRRGVCG